MLKMHKGAAQPALKITEVLNLEIPLPPIEVQRAIAAELDALATTATRLTRAAAGARASMKTTLMLALAGDGQPGAAPQVQVMSMDMPADASVDAPADEVPAPSTPLRDGDLADLLDF